MSRYRAGMTLIELLVVIAIIGILVGLVLSAVQKVRAAAARTACINNMKQISLATHMYHQQHSRLPNGVSMKPESKQLYMSWLTRILPYVEQDAMWRASIKAYAEQPDPFKRPTPHPMVSQSVRLYTCPANDRVATPQHSSGMTVAFTSYLGVNGRDVQRKDGVLYQESDIRFGDITDGLSQTLLCGERPPSDNFFLGWWYAGVGQGETGSADMHLGTNEIILRRNSCGSLPQRFQRGEIKDPCSSFHFWSVHPGGANFAFCDGSVHFLSYSSHSLLPTLATRANGEAIPEFD